MHPVLKRGGLFWDQELLPRDAFAERFVRVQALIAESGDDAWLLYGDVERYGHVAWFSNFLPRTRSALALVPRSGDPAILLSVGKRDVPAAKTLTWINDVRPFSRLARETLALIADKSLTNGRFGLVGVEESIPFADWSEITAALPDARWQTRTEAAMQLRQRKDTHELAAIRRSAQAVAAALDAVPGIVRPGMTTRALAAGVDRVLRRAAAEDVRILMAAGPHCAASLRPPGDEVLRPGDTVMLHAAVEVQRYWAEAARTYVLGRASPAQQTLASRASAALAAMRAAAVPGAAASDIRARADEWLADTRLRASAESYGFGHGIGLDAEEPPFIIAASDHCLVAGATLALRVVAHGDGQGIALGQVVVVSQNGGEPLIDAPALVECD
jgi:Xaa-Pro aminopeptidase